MFTSPPSAPYPSAHRTVARASVIRYLLVIASLAAVVVAIPSVFPPSAAAQTGASYIQLEAGTGHNCAVRSDNKVVCWGLDDLGQAPSSVSYTYTQVSGGPWHTCGVRVDKTLGCWGREQEHGMTPSGTFTHVSVGYGHACAVHTQGHIVCWGRNLEQQAPPLVDGSFLQAAAGEGFSCGLTTEGAIQCWGSYHTAGTEPAGVFKQISVDETHGCALRTADGAVLCWGNNSTGQAPPLREGPFREVSAGIRDTCGVRTNFIVECWGDTPNIWPPTGSGSFRSISVGAFHTCGLKTVGTQLNLIVACFGDNQWNQAIAPPAPFPAPDLRSVSAPTSHSLTLTWTAVPGETQYQIWRRKSDTALAPVQALTFGSGPSIVYVDEGLDTNTQYFYQVRVFKNGVGGNFSGEKNNRTLVAVPAPPTELKITNVTINTIGLAWNDNSSNEQNFVIEFQTLTAFQTLPAPDVTWVELSVLLPANQKTYAHQGRSPNTEYNYRIRAKNPAGKSEPSNEANAVTPVNPPAMVTAGSPTTTSLTITWSGVSSASGYRITRFNAQGVVVGDPAVVLEPGRTTYVDDEPPLTPGTKYGYKVQSLNRENTPSAFSTAQGSNYTLPAVPTLTVGSPTEFSLTLTWNRVDPNSKYDIRRQPVAGERQDVLRGVVNGTTTIPYVFSADPDTEYFFFIRAVNGAGQAGEWSLVAATGKTLPLQPAPPRR